MATRHLYLVRHGDADALGELTATGRRQVELLGARLAALPVDAVWHSPLPRAVASAGVLATHLPGVPVAVADELVDHVPHVPAATQTPASLRGFFDGYDEAEAAAGRALADALVARFATPAPATDTHEVLVTHGFQVAWLVRHALDAPESRWLSLNSGNAALTVIQYRAAAPPALVLFNDMGHLPPALRWTGFPPTVHP